MKLQIIVGSIRENRVTPRLAAWVANEAKKLPETTVEVVDLLEYDLPFFNEPISPRFNPDRHPDAKVVKWITKLAEADAYVFVTPEYNHSITGALKNALDFVTWELLKKPAAAVGHGTVGGARAIVDLKEILSESRAVVIPTQVTFTGRVNETISEDGELDKALSEQPYGPQAGLQNLLTELKWYSDALASARAKDQAAKN